MSPPILVGYDPREAEHAPVDFGIMIARVTGGRLIVVSVEVGRVVDRGGVDADLVADGREAVELIEAKLRSAGVPFESRRTESTSAARGLQEAAEREGAGLLVVGSSRRSGAGRVLAGGTAARLLGGAPCPVAVAPREWSGRDRLETIGVGYVDSPEGREALRSAHALARRVGAQLRVVTVVRITPSMHLEADAVRHSWEPEARDMIDVEGEHRVAAIEHLRSVVASLEGDVEVDALIGDPAEELVTFSSGAGLLVLGARGYGPVRAVLLGSVSRRVASEAHCPIVVLPRGVEASLEPLVSETPGAAAAA